MKNYRKGFTLIELLVVIAIISIFSSVIVAGVSTLRGRAQEATIKADLKSIKNQAELSFNNVGDYSTAAAAVAPIIAGINKSGGTAVFSTYDNTHFAVSARLNSDPTKNWSISDQANVVVWDKDDSSPGTHSWYDSRDYCLSTGGRLPTYEELQAFEAVYGYGVGIPPNFSRFANYWTSTEDSNDTSKAYRGNSYGIISNNKSAIADSNKCVH